MLPKTGKKFPGGNDRENGRLGYAAIIAGALANERIGTEGDAQAGQARHRQVGGAVAHRNDLLHVRPSRLAISDR